MRALVTFFIFPTLFLAVINTAHAQLDAGRWSVEISQRFLQVEEGVLSLNYVDESPSRDNINNDISIGSERALDIGAAYEVPLNDHVVTLGARGVLGELNGYSFDLGYGYNYFRKGAFYARGSGQLSFGRLGVGLGDIINNALFIQVNDTQFYDQRVGVRYVTGIMAFRPALEFGFDFDLGALSGLKVVAGYNLSRDYNPRLKFSGNDIDRETQEEFEDLSEDNVNFRVNGVENDDIPVKFNGLFFSLVAYFGG